MPFACASLSSRPAARRRNRPAPAFCALRRARALFARSTSAARPVLGGRAALMLKYYVTTLFYAIEASNGVLAVSSSALIEPTACNIEAGVAGWVFADCGDIVVTGAQRRQCPAAKSRAGAPW